MNKKQLDILFNSGKKAYGKILKVVYDTGEGVSVISAPKKRFKRAVDRNKIKRLIRESVKEVNYSNINCFIIYNISEIKSLEDIKNDLKNIKINV